MLVLSRKIGEQIVVTGPCILTVTSIGGNRVQVGIEAHPQTDIFRQELKEKEALDIRASFRSIKTRLESV